MFNLSNILSVIVSSEMLFYSVLCALIIIAALLFGLIFYQNRELKKYVDSIENEFNEEIINDDIKEEFDILSVTKELEEMPNSVIELNTYEAMQEEKAIISYDELIANASNVSIGYMDENDNDDIVVKQVDLSCTGKIELDPIKKALNSRVSIATYDHEEEFLDALKQLNKLLN